jgi:hypothetical protein
MGSAHGPANGRRVLTRQRAQGQIISMT